LYVSKPTEKRTINGTRFQCEHIIFIEAFVDIRSSLVRDAHQLIAVGYRDPRPELDLTKGMVYGEAKKTFKETAFDSHSTSAVLQVEPELDELLENKN
jgi:hypothetical protein